MSLTSSPRLLVIKGPLVGQSHTLHKGRFTIGRQSDNDLALQQREVSRHHCVIHCRKNHYSLHDLDSRQGTFVNNLPVRVRELKHRDVIAINDSELLFLAAAGLAQADPESLTAEAWSAASTIELEPSASYYLKPLPDGDLSRETASDLETLYAINRLLHHSHNGKTLASELLKQLLSALPADRGGVFLDEPGGETWLAASQPRDSFSKAAPASQTIIERARQERTALLGNDVRPTASRSSGSESPRAVGARSCICAPLVRNDHILGIIYLDCQNPGNFEQRHLELVAAAAISAALAFDNARHVAWLRSENHRLSQQQLRHDMVGESRAMRELYRLLKKVAPSDSTVLVRGESGTGKELVARAIHQDSRRAEKPFVAINCATLSESLLESELFGHERGAFTGALERKIGKLEAAHGGTLFLDEMGDIPATLQARLLRVLQERTFERVGSNFTIDVDFRLVAATNRNLEAAIRDGTFREDLFYRLNVITVTLPPLRQRQGDIALLSRHFSRCQGQRLGRTVIGPSPEALVLLEAYAWPGNVRQLANVMERAVVLGDSEWIHPEDLPEELIEGNKVLVDHLSIGHYQTALIATKKALIHNALKRSGGSYRQAAESLGLHINSLHRLIRQLDLKDDFEH